MGQCFSQSLFQEQYSINYTVANTQNRLASRRRKSTYKERQSYEGMESEQISGWMVDGGW